MGFLGGLTILQMRDFSVSELMGLPVEGGISKRIQTNFGWTLNPFCGVSYSRSWTRISTKGVLEETGRNRISSHFGGRAGLEVEVSPTISVIGAFGVSFKNIDGSFSIGLKFSLKVSREFLR